MIQFNLLPDVKLEYIKAQRTKRSVIAIAGIVIGVCVVTIILLVSTVYGLQRRHIANVTEDIQTTANEIKSIEQIDRILTVQNQLTSVNDLHMNKPVTSRVFEFIETVTPNDVNLSRLELNHEMNRIELDGSAETLAVINRYVDTLKFTEYFIVELDENGEVVEESLPEDDDELERAFISVVLDSFGRTGEDNVNYSIIIEFKPEIFDRQDNVQLRVRDTITTRSEVDRPEALFQAPEEVEGFDG